ncbi:MAG: AAA family ATPase [Myxococcaceae bacterium]
MAFNVPRLLQVTKKYSFFLFGPRGVGKSTLLHQLFPAERTLWIDLLDPGQEQRFSLNPSELFKVVEKLDPSISHVAIDEIQKVPKLLDVVHSLIESTSKLFILTGSSARKLKLGGANLLAGRAFVYHMHALTSLELDTRFDLDEALSFGTLPKIYSFDSSEEKQMYLQAYGNTYLKEEVWAEQLVKKIGPFRKFLEVAAQTNGKIVNFSNVARDVGVTERSVRDYFSILEDTMLGYFLEPFQHSFRKRLSQKPKFYFFDRGIVRALGRSLSVPLIPHTSAYGEAFEHFIITQVLALCSYFHSEYRLNYLRTKDDAEIDLVVERPGQPLLCIEIKSKDLIKEEDLSSFTRLTKDLPDCEAICISNERHAKRYGHVDVLPWKDALQRYFGPEWPMPASNSGNSIGEQALFVFRQSRLNFERKNL